MPFAIEQHPSFMLLLICLMHPHRWEVRSLVCGVGLWEGMKTAGEDKMVTCDVKG